MSTADTISHISVRLSELIVDIIERQNELEKLKRERDALQHAYDALEALQDDILDAALGDGNQGGLTYKQKVVFQSIPIGKNNALSPSIIAQGCPSLDSGYVRKTLQRFARYGHIKAANGVYWRLA